MKCNRCEFERCKSNEDGTEYYCALFEYDTPEEFEIDEGCNLRYNEAKKFYELNDECIAKYYDGMYLSCVLDEGKPTKEQQAEMDKVNKEYISAQKKLQNYYNVLLNRRKKNDRKRFR